MAIHLFKDAELTQQISEGDLQSPDSDVFNGTDGEFKDRQLYLANEQTTLASGIDEAATTVSLTEARFADGEVIIIDAEQMHIASGGGTTELIVERGYAGTSADNHSLATKVYSGYNYSDLTVVPADEVGSSEASWVKLGSAQAALESAVAGASHALGNKAHNTTLAFWRRLTVPAGTPVQNKTDIKLRLTGTESPII